MRKEDNEGVAVIGKMARILDLLALDNTLNPTQVSQRLQIPRTTVHRILQTMVAEHIVTDSYLIGPRTIRWASRALKGSGLREMCAPSLDHLVSVFGETASVFIPTGAARICLDRREGTEPVRHSIEIGAALPIHVGSAGRILLAWLDDQERERLVEESHAWSGLPVVEIDWALVREQGWVTTSGERDPMVASVSVPVFDVQHRVVLALSLSGPRARLSKKRREDMVEALLEQGGIIGDQLERVTR